MSAKAQTKNDIFNPNTTITWLGLDFTAAQFVGDREEWRDTTHTLEIIEALNTLIIKEKEKFYIAAAINKDKVDYQPEVTMSHNSRINLEDMLTDKVSEHFLKSADIQDIVSRYNYKGLNGIGLMFNIQAFNKSTEQAILWITFINMSTKEVLFTEKMTDAPSGFGLRNYWAGAIYKIMKEVRKSDYERWRKKYYRKDS